MDLEVDPPPAFAGVVPNRSVENNFNNQGLEEPGSLHIIHRENWLNTTTLAPFTAAS